MNPIAIGILLLFAGIGIAGTISNIRNYRKCCTEVIARVVENICEEKSDPDTGRELSYFPVFSYTFQGNCYHVRHSMGSGKPAYMLGQEVALKIDPDHPETHVVCGEKGNWFLFIICILVGVVPLVLELTGVWS